MLKKSPTVQPLRSGIRSGIRQCAHFLSSAGAAALETIKIKVTLVFRLELSQYIAKKQTNKKTPGLTTQGTSMRTLVLISAMISGAGYIGLVPANIMHAGMPVTWTAGALITMSMVFALAKG